MIDFNVGAMRQAGNEARSHRLAAANDLVRRTLAQHGLMPQAGLSRAKANPASALGGLPVGRAARFAVGADVEDAIPTGAQFRSGQFDCHAGSRRFRTYVPATSKDGVAGVLLMLHGCTQTPEDFAIGTGMNALAETHRLVVVYPHQSRGDNAQSCWNWFSRGDQQRGRGEPAILAGIAQQVSTEFGIGRDRSFVAGLSAGGAMAVVLGETYGDVFSGVGVHSGLPFGVARDVPSAFAAMAGNSPDAVARPRMGPSVRTIIFHGTADKTVHPSNGDRIVRQAIDRRARQTVESEIESNIAGRSYRWRIVAGTDGGPALEHWVIEGLGHAWSGGQQGGSYTDANGPDASAEMVRFFLDS